MWRRFLKWIGWGEPFRVTITTTRSPDWNGDAARWREQYDRDRGIPPKSDRAG
jgi:hypothetical protein